MSSKNDCGAVSRLKDSASKVVVTYDIASCSNSNTDCLKDLIFMFITQNKLSNGDILLQ